MEEVHAPEALEVVSEVMSEIPQHQEISVQLDTKEAQLKQVRAHCQYGSGDNVNVGCDLSELQAQCQSQLYIKGQYEKRGSEAVLIRATMLLQESRTLTLQTYLSEENIHGLVDEMPSPTVQEGQEIRYDLGQSESMQQELSMVSHIEDYLSPEEEEDIFFEAHEPALEGADTPAATRVADTTQRESMLTKTLEEQLAVEGTEEANVEFTQEQPDEQEIRVDLGAAQARVPLASQVPSPTSPPPILHQLSSSLAPYLSLALPVRQSCVNHCDVACGLL